MQCPFADQTASYEILSPPMGVDDDDLNVVGEVNRTSCRSNSFTSIGNTIAVDLGGCLLVDSGNPAIGLTLELEVACS